MKKKKEKWFGTSLVIASHIHDLMKEQFNLRYRDYLSEYESRCEPVAHWKDVLLMEEKMNLLKVSTVNIGFRVVLVLLLIFTFFFFLGYPFSDLEIKILVGAGILLLLGVAILIGMLSNVIAGFAGFLIGGYIFDFICEFVVNLLHLPESDIAMLYIYRVIAIVLIVYLLYSITNSIKDNKEANRFLIQVVRERTFLKDHAQKCYNALNLIQNIVDEDDMRDIGAMKDI